MPGRLRVLGISPILSVRDVAVSVAFYVRYLGFRKVFVMEDLSYGVVGRDGQTVHFSRARDGMDERATRTRVAIYVAVRGIDTQWQALLRDPPPTRMRSLSTTPWGMREFHVLDPDGCLVRFGEEHG